MSNIAIFGGTFNPPHNAHIQIVRYLLEQLLFNHIYIVPSIPWQKSDVTSSEARLAMCKLSFENIQHLSNKISISTYEIDKNKPSYSIDTVKHFKELNPNSHIILIIGYDQLINLRTWHRWEDLFNYCTIHVIRRRNNETDQKTNINLSLLNSYINSKLITLDEWKPINISSTQVREVAHAKNYPELSQYVDLKVAKYIIHSRLYSNI